VRAERVVTVRGSEIIRARFPRRTLSWQARSARPRRPVTTEALAYLPCPVSMHRD
jgi:hypothetical protein